MFAGQSVGIKQTALRLIFWRLKQMRPHVVTVTVLSWNG
jgi:hypothetical protein